MKEVMDDLKKFLFWVQENDKFDRLHLHEELNRECRDYFKRTEVEKNDSEKGQSKNKNQNKSYANAVSTSKIEETEVNISATTTNVPYIPLPDWTNKYFKWLFATQFKNNQKVQYLSNLETKLACVLEAKENVNISVKQPAPDSHKQSDPDSDSLDNTCNSLINNVISNSTGTQFFKEILKDFEHFFIQDKVNTSTNFKNNSNQICNEKLNKGMFDEQIDQIVSKLMNDPLIIEKHASKMEREFRSLGLVDTNNLKSKEDIMTECSRISEEYFSCQETVGDWTEVGQKSVGSLTPEPVDSCDSFDSDSDLQYWLRVRAKLFFCRFYFGCFMSCNFSSPSLFI